ncbi:Predicted Rossmann fold nucleotide-binding protein [Rhodospirillaceae bacterium LM-1]|nr:Predicted Rossmann fold nucleotide-binding protein [Rhodospirillaceae bacterium LM-1]
MPRNLARMNKTSRPLEPAERLDWLRLNRSERVGPVTFHRLIERFGTASAALAALPDLAKRGGKQSGFKVCAKSEAEKELAAASRLGAQVVAWCEPAYPAWLKATEDAPPLVCVLGNLHLLQKPMVGIVGARNASINGRRFAKRLAESLGAAGIVVASGMARGIDGAAHEGALANGTVAVLAGGVDNIYPPEHADLYRRIVDAGAVMSEMPPGTVPQASHFPRRNRIVSGLSLGLVVVEAAAKSGSLITARLAAEQGREVFAVPGHPDDPRAHGPNRLIKDGACLVSDPQDVLNVVTALLRRPLSEPAQKDLFDPPTASLMAVELDRAREEILAILGLSPVSVDEILRECHLSPPVVATVLLELELAGRLERHPGNRVARLADA